MMTSIAINKPYHSPLFLIPSFHNHHTPTSKSIPTLKLAPQSPSISLQKPTNLEEIRQLQAHILRTHLPKCNSFEPHNPNIASLWNSIITGYTKNNRPDKAINVYHVMRSTNLSLDTFTLPSIFKACAYLSAIQQGKEIHGFILKTGLNWDIFVQNSLVNMYSECGFVEYAREVFDEMIERDVVSWSTMIGCYGHNRCFSEAIDLLKEMQASEMKPSEITLINLINLFADMRVLKIGKQIHGYVLRNASSQMHSLPLNSALIDMYVKCKNLKSARNQFGGMTQRSIVSWTIMMVGYVGCGDLEESVKLFNEMKEEKVEPNEITMLSLLLECGNMGALEMGKWVHVYLIKNGFEMSVSLVTALLDMYGKCEETESARSLFDTMPRRDVMAWTAMISSYANAKCMDQAVQLFSKMQDHKMKPNQVTMVNLLMVCASLGALDTGKWIHLYIEKLGVKPEDDVVLATALVDMYAKSGDIERAQQVFTRVPNKDICMWNAMISGLAMHGHAKEAISLFSKMEAERIKPNDVTFVGVLHACGHSGKVDAGRMLFERMVHEFGIMPKVEHYGCMVDLLGRAGMLDDAHDMINGMPMKPNTIVWGSLLAACKLHNNLGLGEMVAKELLELEPNNCGYHVLLSNIYAKSNRWDDVAGVRKLMRKKGIKKEPGFSSIEVNGSIHEFVMGDKSHPQTEEIHGMLDEMSNRLKEAGHVANTSVVLLNIEEEERETTLTYHTEKLAIAFGLISTAPCTPIRIVKNLRVCDDCHSATKLISKIYGREIIVRDRNRYHHFKEGSCSCRDYW
ncbi:hypothetical protein AMTRI_Chr07g29760 [Amborella trichopoda]|uniref:pentatricopeptide repeat-containing protein At4g21065-like n=1 Tax=Amborella trichopoda TaxID=13333 RepID=UPI0005D412BD|nr:pentatricopeptide repeat-containing protein At4g21065-like [Amborella trichopoda]|eukprot:XP_011624686.1 pentatricopeptide repeat-containing protein At4g21065-like [Amborella trichopoda]